MKILISAFACEPNKGSEPGVGWNWAVHLSKYVCVTVLTRTNNRAVIEQEIKINPHKNLSFIYYDIPLLCKLKKLIPLGVQIYYILWQLSFCLYVIKSHNDRFDIFHHITFNSFSIPSFGWLISKKFIWGPIGGGQTVPTNLLKYFGNKVIFEIVRTIYVKSARFNPVIILCSYFSSKILVANKETEEKIWYRKKIIRMLETGVNKINKKAIPFVEVGEKPLNVLWIGELEPHKAPYLLVDAAKYINTNIEISLIGDGKLKRCLIEKAKRINVISKINFIGKIDHKVIWDYYQLAEIFVFTSMRDTSGNVVLEAMSQGLPIIAFDHQGMHDILNNECAIKIPVSNYTKMVKDLASAIDELASNVELRKIKGKESLQRIKDYYLWENKAKIMVKIYEQIINENSSSS